MSKIWNWIFTPYDEDQFSSYLHSGVGYGGIIYAPYEVARKKHHGVGYGGIYD